ncbi:MAG: response regulator [Acidobacteria bacterium]|nr:response regulator [Acidobacteriota bacterium]
MRSPRVLLLSASETETAELEQILSEYVSLTLVSDPSKLDSLLENEVYDALFCAWALPRATWTDVLDDVREFHPDLPVIVLAPAPEVRQWAQVLDAGAFDLLIPPYQQCAVLATLGHASISQQAWNSLQESQFKLRA